MGDSDGSNSKPDMGNAEASQRKDFSASVSDEEIKAAAKQAGYVLPKVLRPGQYDIAAGIERNIRAGYKFGEERMTTPGDPQAFELKPTPVPGAETGTPKKIR